MVVALLAVWTLVPRAQGTPLFTCPFGDETCSVTGGGTTELGYNGLAESVLGTCGVADAYWQRDHFASGGFNNGPYTRITWCTAAEAGLTGPDYTRPSGYSLTAPAALDTAIAATTTFYGKVCLKWNNHLDGTGSNIRTYKFAMAHQNVYDGDQRAILFAERGDTAAGGSTTLDVAMAIARNINNTDRAEAALTVGEWQCIQWSWLHGVEGVSFVKIWEHGAHTEGSPTDQDLTMSEVNANPGGTSEWVRDNAGYDPWSMGTASNATTALTSRVSVDIANWQLDDEFDTTWGSGASPASGSSFRRRLRRIASLLVPPWIATARKDTP